MLEVGDLVKYKVYEDYFLRPMPLNADAPTKYAIVEELGVQRIDTWTETISINPLKTRVVEGRVIPHPLWCKVLMMESDEVGNLKAEYIRISALEKIC
tara:strand:+ start:11644 stop:11937 length:294 start_codon:yes stop_codon:yes gene_type:complete